MSGRRAAGGTRSACTPESPGRARRERRGGPGPGRGGRRSARGGGRPARPGGGESFLSCGGVSRPPPTRGGARLKTLGYPYADILRNYDVDVAALRAVATQAW